MVGRTLHSQLVIRSFWATYTYSAFLQTQFGLDAVAVAALTTVRLWMRLVGAVLVGFIGDRFHPVRSLGIAIFFAGVSLIALLVLPADSSYTLLYLRWLHRRFSSMAFEAFALGFIQHYSY